MGSAVSSLNSKADHQLGANHLSHQAIVSSAGLLLVRLTVFISYGCSKNFHEFGAFNNTNLFVYSSRGWKSEVLFIKPKPGCQKGCAPSRDSREEPISWSFSASRAPFLGLWTLCPSKPVVQHLQTPSPPIMISPPAFCVKSPIASHL